MIDMHTHILPGIDNGCGDYKEAEKMIDEAISLGIKEIILTPHQKGFAGIDRKSIINRYNTFRKWFEKKDIKFHLGSEIDYSSEVLEKIENRELLTMNGTNVVMLDFLDCPNENIIDVVRSFKAAGYKVIVSHIEYYTKITHKDIIKLKDIGALIQVDAETIIDKKYEKWLKVVFKERLIDFVASNCHTANTKNYMRDAYEVVIKKTSEDYAELIFKRNQKNFFLL